MVVKELNNNIGGLIMGSKKYNEYEKSIISDILDDIFDRSVEISNQNGTFDIADLNIILEIIRNEISGE